MEPKSSSSDIVTLLNIDNEDFYFDYNKSEGNPSYVIEAGKVTRLPRWLADHALKHLLDKILTKKKIKTTHETERAALAEEIVIGVESLHRRREPTEDERVRAEVEELNKPSTLEAILAKRKEKEEKAEKEAIDTTQAMEELPKVKEERFEGLPKEEKVEVKEEPKPEVKAKPTRKELYEYALKQNMVLDEPDKENKTLRQRLEKMTIDSVIKEIQYPLEE